MARMTGIIAVMVVVAEPGQNRRFTEYLVLRCERAGRRHYKKRDGYR